MTARILLTNDDGLQAEGLQTLYALLSPHYDVWAVAPDREQSAKSHALTLHRPLRINQLAPQQFSVDGTPADCVYVAVHQLLKEPPQLVISGINHGANLGDDVAYSGTVSAAMEAVFMELPAIAVSMPGRAPFRFATAAGFIQQLVQRLLSQPMEPRTFLNVNVPSLPADQIAGVRVTRLGHRRFTFGVEEKVDPRGRKYYWIGGDELTRLHGEGSDFNAVQERFISVTPLHTDLTDYRMIGKLSWVNEPPLS